MYQSRVSLKSNNYNQYLRKDSSLGHRAYLMARETCTWSVMKSYTAVLRLHEPLMSKVFRKRRHKNRPVETGTTFWNDNESRTSWGCNFELKNNREYLASPWKLSQACYDAHLNVSRIRTSCISCLLEDWAWHSTIIRPVVTAVLNTINVAKTALLCT
jgi:hypothetical protein